MNFEGLTPCVLSSFMTDSSGAVAWSGEYLPFGEPYSVTGSVINNLRFPGQYYDSETGLHQNWHRDYKPELGRYIEADPIGIEGGSNPFAYVDNRPLTLDDPLGLLPFETLPISGCDYYREQCNRKTSECDENANGKDTYSCKAYQCCKDFGCSWTASCVRGCLISYDKRHCSNLTGEQRHNCRKIAHVECYSRCNALPLLLDVPESCKGIW
ncbi:MAG: RHS repeat-associated core domain-containing protein [Nitrospirae bacterium]|nr:RHS repeat-associated core domain-containing protein [Nitrospirota bacterium]